MRHETGRALCGRGWPGARRLGLVAGAWGVRPGLAGGADDLVGWPLGSLGLLLVHRLAGGRWGVALSPGLWLGVRSLWLLVPAAAVLLVLVRPLYPWARDSGYGPYLQLPFFAVRGALYLAVWLGLGALTLRSARRDGPSAALAIIGSHCWR